MRQEEGTFRGHDGLALYWRAWLPEEPKVTVLVAHGLGEHSGRYGNLVDAVTPQGYAVYALDHRGHGRSAGQRGHVRRFDDYLLDLSAFAAFVQGRHPPCSTFLVGHSMGGLIALAYAIRFPEGLTGVVASAPALKLKAKVPAWKRAVGQVMSSLLPTLALASGLDARLLSHDPAVVEAYVTDPLVHDRVSTRLYTEMVRMGADTVAAAKLRLPCLLMHGTADGLTDPEGSRAFYAAATVEDKTLRLYEDFYHEIFNEVDKARPLADLVAWLEERA